MTGQKMTLIRFTEIIAAYGAMPDRWPVDERDAIADFIVGNEMAKTCLDDADGLDAELDHLPAGQPMGAGLQSRLLQIGIQDSSASFIRWVFAPRRMIPQAAGFALAAYLGVMAGSGGALEDEGDLSAYLFGANDGVAESWDLEGENR